MKYLALLALTFTLVACQSTNSNETGTTGDAEAATSSGINGVYAGGSYDPATGLNGSYQPGAASGYNAASNSDHYSNPNYGKNVVGGPNAQAKDRVIYFSYDSSAIDSRAEAIVQQHAAYLKKHPNTRILLEGHTDSRGSREYNIALGERRAIAVLKRFQALGVPVSQIRIISYGEENPAVSGFSEDAYRRNRRAVIQY